MSDEILQRAQGLSSEKIAEVLVAHADGAKAVREAPRAAKRGIYDAWLWSEYEITREEVEGMRVEAQTEILSKFMGWCRLSYAGTPRDTLRFSQGAEEPQEPTTVAGARKAFVQTATAAQEAESVAATDDEGDGYMQSLDPVRIIGRWPVWAKALGLLLIGLALAWGLQP